MQHTKYLKDCNIIYYNEAGAEKNRKVHQTLRFSPLKSPHISKLFITFTHVDTSARVASHRDVQIKPQTTFFVLRDKTSPFTFSLKKTNKKNKNANEGFSIFSRIIRARKKKKSYNSTKSRNVSFLLHGHNFDSDKLKRRKV